jgi:hypothetical protein
MKKQKMSFKIIKDVLSRDEMRNIMAGSSGTCGYCAASSTACGHDPNFGCICPLGIVRKCNQPF